jgi:hypothetical protein
MHCRHSFPISRFCFHGLVLVGIVIYLASCSASKRNYLPARKYAPAALQADYTIFREILESNHPGMYWYTPKDSMDMYFQQGYAQLQDSMTEQEFRRVLAYVVSQINCGHTITRPSKAAVSYQNKHRITGFPFSIKFLDSLAVVSDNLQRRDSLITRGAVIHAINGLPIELIRDSLSRYLSNDGYNTGHGLQLLNGRSTFTTYYQLVFGLDSLIEVELTDTLNRLQRVQRRVIYPTPAVTKKKSAAAAPVKDTSTRRKPAVTPPARPTSFSKKGLMIDTTESIGYMVLNTFSNGSGIAPFIRKSFKTIDRLGLEHVIIDIRFNGGGNVSNSNLLLKYLKDEPFRLADSLYTPRKTYKHGRYIQGSMWQWPLMSVITHRDAAGRRHFGYYERHYFKPKKRHHYPGNVYLITGYNSFSASSIVAHQLKDHPRVTSVGEPTGGAHYGNNAWLTPTATLPQTHLRFTLPRFRLVMDRNIPKNGQGVPVDITAIPTRRSIMLNRDVKMEAVGTVIRKRKS